MMGIAKGMLPVLLGLSVTQLNTLCDSLLAWGLTAPAEPTDFQYPLDSGTAAALYFGQRMYQFPLGIFAVAIGTVIFPLLSLHAERGELDLFRNDFSRGIRLVIAITIPASAGMFLVSEPLTEVLLQRGEFSGEDSQRTASGAYAK